MNILSGAVVLELVVLIYVSGCTKIPTGSQIFGHLQMYKMPIYVRIWSLQDRDLDSRISENIDFFLFCYLTSDICNRK